jgi:glyoxylate reductase
MGRIGLRYAGLIRPLTGTLLYSSRSQDGAAEAVLDARRVSLDELLARSDVVSLHLPVSPETLHMIDASALEAMKPDAILVNTARGGLVDSQALAAALREGRLGAAALDVFEHEPSVPDVLLEAPRLVLTPHIGSATHRARDGMAEMVAANVIAVLDGREPLNEVPPPA